MRHLLLAVTTMTLLAGCTLPGMGDESGPKNYSAVGLAVVDVDLPVTVVELGDAFSAEATVVNNGATAAADTFQVRIGQSVLTSKMVDVAAKSFAHVELTFTITTYGEHAVRFAFGENEQTETLRVRAPRIADVSFDYDNLDCKAELPFTLTFRNAGDGEARDVVVVARVVNTNDIEQDNGTKTVARVAAGKTGKVEFTLFAPDVCKQEDYFRVRATITPRLAEPVSFVSDPVVL